VRIKWLGLARVLGLAMVLIYHFFRRVLPGGFLGVDLFFTLSGYLTTALFVEEFRKTGGLKWLDFCKRRFMRIFPPLFLSVIITLPFALLTAPDFTGGIDRQAAGALGFVTNYLEILSGGSYEAQMLPHLYIHTWSLALEMHYYLLWGLACLGITALVWLLMKDENRRLPLLKWGLALPALLLAGLCWWNMQRLFAASPGNPTAAYFDSAAHALPFFIGSAAGALFGIQIDEKTAARLRNRVTAGISVAVMVLAAGGLAAMGVLFTFSQQRTYQVGFPLASLLAAVLICAARALHEAAPGVREPRAIGFVADTSYGVYLFHWPLYIVFSNVFIKNWLASLLTLGLSLGLAAMTFYGIEPLLHGKKPWKKRPLLLRTFYPAVAVLVLCGLAGSGLVFARAPVINDLELPIMVGHIYQDAQSAADMERRLSSLRAEPMPGRGRPPAWSDAVHDPSLADSDWVPAVYIDEVPGGVTFLGDSVALGAVSLLQQTIPGIFVDAEISRTLPDGRELLLEWQADASLRETVVIALGTNNTEAWQVPVDAMVEELPAGCRLILVTPYIGNPLTEDIYHAEVAAYYRQLARTLPYVTVADWAQAIIPNPDYLAADKVHFYGRRAAQLFVDLVLEAVAEAERKPGKPG